MLEADTTTEAIADQDGEQLDIADAVAAATAEELAAEKKAETEVEAEPTLGGMFAPKLEATPHQETSSQTPLVADRAEDLVAKAPAFVPAPMATMPDADVVPTAEESPVAQPRLIKRLKGLWSTKPGDEPVAETAQTPAADTAESGPSILDLPRADMVQQGRDSSPQQTLDATDDDLDIPAFLRRQAN